MSGERRQGSALVITMLILVILTAAALYAVGISGSGIESVSDAERDQVARNAAEAGLFYGIDRFPYQAGNGALRLPNGAEYDVSVSHTGTVPLHGYDMDWAQALFRVRAVGSPTDDPRIRATAEAEAAFGPVLSGTEPLDRADGPYRTAGFLVGPPSPFYHDPRDLSARIEFIRRNSRRTRILIDGAGAGMVQVLDAFPADRVESSTPPESIDGTGRGGLTVADIPESDRSGRDGGASRNGWRTLAVAGAGGEEGGYYAFVLTDPGSGRFPGLLWAVTQRSLPMLGRNRSTPAIGKVRLPARGAEAPDGIVDRWVVLIGAEKGILVLDAGSGGIIQMLSHPGMGEVAAPPAIALDREGYIERVYVGDLSGNLWRAVTGGAGRFELGTGPFFSITRQEVEKAIHGKCSIVPGEGTSHGVWVFFGSGDLGNRSEGARGGLFAVYDDTSGGGPDGGGPRTITERDLTDASRFFSRIRDPEAAFPPLEGTARKGWYSILPGSGERILSSPRVFFFNLFLTTYRPGRNGSGTEGTGRIYGIGIIPGKNLGDPAIFGGVASPRGMERVRSTARRVERIRYGGIPGSPVISFRHVGEAILTVHSGDEGSEDFPIPAPRRWKSVRSWKIAGRESGAED